MFHYLQQDLNLNNSFASTAKSVPEETSNQRPARERKKKKTKLQEVQPSKEEKPKIVEKPEVQKKKEEKPEPNKEVRTLKSICFRYNLIQIMTPKLIEIFFPHLSHTRR